MRDTLLQGRRGRSLAQTLFAVAVLSVALVVNTGSTDINGDVMKAINDFERRKQLGAMRPGPAKATGVRKYTSAISNALKAGQVSEEDLLAALETAGVTIPVPTVTDVSAEAGPDDN